MPHPVIPGVGYSAVNLEKDVAWPTGTCESRGIGAHFSDVVEQGLPGQSPSEDDGGGVSPLVNPTEARDVQPNRRVTDFNERRPELRNADGTPLYEIPAHGNGVRWEAACTDPERGRGVGNNLDVGGAEAAGSSTVGVLDKRTGRYTGTARAFVAGLRTTGGTLDLVTSVFRVDALPGREPVFSYRIATTDGTLAEGVDLPSRDLTKQFNDSVRNNAGAFDSIAPLGLTVMGPTVSASGSDRPVLNAPFLQLTVGLESRRGTLGQTSHVRLVNVDFEGGYFQ